MSMNYADLYGLPSDLSATIQPTSVVGPTQGSVVPPGGKNAPVASAGGPAATVAFSWLGFVLLLIAWRILIELSPSR